MTTKPTAQELAAMFDAFDEVQQVLINDHLAARDPAVKELRRGQREQYSQAMNTLHQLFNMQSSDAVAASDFFLATHNKIEEILALLAPYNNNRVFAELGQVVDQTQRTLLNEEFLQAASRDAVGSLHGRLVEFFKNEVSVTTAQMLIGEDMVGSMRWLRSSFDMLDIAAARAVVRVLLVAAEDKRRLRRHPLMETFAKGKVLV